MSEWWEWVLLVGSLVWWWFSMHPRPDELEPPSQDEVQAIAASLGALLMPEVTEQIRKTDGTSFRVEQGLDRYTVNVKVDVNWSSRPREIG